MGTRLSFAFAYLLVCHSARSEAEGEDPAHSAYKSRVRWVPTSPPTLQKARTLSADSFISSSASSAGADPTLRLLRTLLRRSTRMDRRQEARISVLPSPSIGAAIWQQVTQTESETSAAAASSLYPMQRFSIGLPGFAGSDLLPPCWLLIYPRKGVRLREVHCLRGADPERGPGDSGTNFCAADSKRSP